MTTAVRRYAGQPGIAASDAGSLRLDLLASLQAMRSSLLGQDAALILGLLVAMRRDPELASAVRDQVLAAKREAFGTAIGRAIARGEVRATTDPALLAEISSAVLLSRLLVTGEPLDDAFVEQLVDECPRRPAPWLVLRLSRYRRPADGALSRWTGGVWPT